MSGIMMLADPDWFAYHERNSVGKLAVFYASPHKRTYALEFLFCVRPGKKPRKIVGVGRIKTQQIVNQDTAWERYGAALGADTEREWRKQAAAVLENSRRTYRGDMLAIELIDFQPFPSPVLPEAVGLADDGWSDKKRSGDDATALLLELLGANSPAIAPLKREFDELQSCPRTPQVLQKVQRVIELYERQSSITRYVKRTRGTTCQLCGYLGFLMRDGNRYCEVHHLMHLSKKPHPDCLRPDYLIVLCATCHRRMHYANIGEPVRKGAEWHIRLDKQDHRFLVSG